MKCNCYYCIYFYEEKCLLDHVEIGEDGKCDSCIFMKIKDDIIKIKKDMYEESKKRFRIY